MALEVSVARSPLRPCSYPGCPTLVESGRCDAHKAVSGWKRDKERQRLYDSARWRRFRKAYLASHPFCVECMRIDITTPSEHVDHVTPHRGDPVKFWQGPFQALCASCHSRKTLKEMREGW